jgi:D-glycero-D-manno-heptose 1,7-bisphosphate phosphatase
MTLEPLYLDGPAGLPAPVSPRHQRPGDRRPRSTVALLCDRDGTIIENRDDYVLDPSHVRFLPGAVDALRRATEHGFTVVLISNQSPVGRGLLTTVDAIRIHRSVLSGLSAAGATIAGTYLCPHAPSHRCPCRKPAPGMLLAAIKRFGLLPARTVMIGDAPEDMAAARSAGVAGVRVRTGRGRVHPARHAVGTRPSGAPPVADLGAAVDLVGGWFGDPGVRHRSQRECLCAE